MLQSDLVLNCLGTKNIFFVYETKKAFPFAGKFSLIAGTVQRRKVKVKKQKKDQRIYDDDELDAESEYDSVGSADLDKLIARQICKLLLKDVEMLSKII